MAGGKVTKSNNLWGCLSIILVTPPPTPLTETAIAVVHGNQRPGDEDTMLQAHAVFALGQDDHATGGKGDTGALTVRKGQEVPNTSGKTHIWDSKGKQNTHLHGKRSEDQYVLSEKSVNATWQKLEQIHEEKSI